MHHETLFMTQALEEFDVPGATESEDKLGPDRNARDLPESPGEPVDEGLGGLGPEQANRSAMLLRPSRLSLRRGREELPG